MTRRPAARQRNQPATARRRAAAAPRGPSIVADVLLAVAAGCLSMAATVGIVSTIDDQAVLGEPGRQLLWSFSATLVVAGLMLGAMGVLLLHGARHAAESYLAPLAAGFVGGAIAAVLLLDLRGDLLWLPALLLIPALRPVRRRLFAPLYRGGRR